MPDAYPICQRCREAILGDVFHVIIERIPPLPGAGPAVFACCTDCRWLLLDFISERAAGTFDPNELTRTA